MPNAYSATAQEELDIAKAKTLIGQEHYYEAIAILEHLPKKPDSHTVYLFLGDAYAAIDQPEKAQYYYKLVYHNAQQSNNSLFQRIALFKVARTQLWLNQNQDAIHSYRLLLQMKLSTADEIIAKRGLETAQHQNQQTIKKVLPQTLEEKARHFLQSNQGDKAFALIKDQLGKTNHSAIYLIAAESMASNDNPKLALTYYQKALELSKTPREKTNALYGIAKMQFWLGRYVRAARTYRLLLTYPLNPRQRELALAGLVKSLAYYDRPRQGYLSIPKDLTFTTPDLTIAAAQASSWANWSDITKSILTTYQPMLTHINPQSPLGKDLRDLQWQTNLATSPGVLTPSIFASHDSEDFNKTRPILDYTHYWNQLAQTSVGLDYITYRQNTDDLLNKLDARGVYIGQTLRPTRELIFRGQVEPIEFKNLTPGFRNTWSPVFWNLNAAYTPNDYVSLRFLGLREVIETFPAFANHITDNQYSSSIILNPFPYIQFNGAYSRLDMSDTNHRNVYYFSSTVPVLPDYGINATGIFREFTNQFTSPNYFSPDTYTAGTLLLKMSRRLGVTWHYYVDGGGGRQFIKPQPGETTSSSPIYQWGFGITGPINNYLILNAYYADMHQASAFLDSPGYHYQYGGVSLNILMW
jgi:tetratricopeptide (TPR) repeat protein